ncbi:MAG: sulfotransferase family 2 domain-containing protein [Deltaproteobacteria bacterium]|nr:sulfotransferase family 2 domain-containing protein [Deltaproteobacteria bacterium]
MLINLRYKFLFVHVAKTGGTSLRAGLKRLDWRDPFFPWRWLAGRISHGSGHRVACKLPRHAKIVAAHEMLPREIFNSLYKFAFVRNPWDLQVSSFHHLRRERPHLLAGCHDFYDFLRYKLDPDRPYQYHLDTTNDLQSDYLLGLHGELLVDFIGRYERLEEDFDALCRHLRLPAIRLEHRRQAKDRAADYRVYYSPEAAELVARHWQADIERFGYSF